MNGFDLYHACKWMWSNLGKRQVGPKTCVYGGIRLELKDGSWIPSKVSLDVPFEENWVREGFEMALASPEIIDQVLRIGSWYIFFDSTESESVYQYLKSRHELVSALEELPPIVERTYKTSKPLLIRMRSDGIQILIPAPPKWKVEELLEAEGPIDSWWIDLPQQVRSIVSTDFHFPVKD